MDLADASIAEQTDAFVKLIRLNPVIDRLLDRMPELELPDGWLSAGCLAQTVWNVLCDRDLRLGISDYDLTYFDGSDLSAAAEAATIARAGERLGCVADRLEIRNEARVHLWYSEKFGAVCAPYRNTRHAISTFPSSCSCVGVRWFGEKLEVYAPFGLTDIYAMRVRPNPVLAPAAVYLTKTRRWQEQWPMLEILPWPDATA